ncbi:MAG: CBS domain-containing protein [Planctomycetes bacterium]|nr:CBS domain-containing protein [Planctomycetota bacterium]
MTTTQTQTDQTPVTWKDFVPDVDVRWCPGCGDYAILNTIQKVFPTLGIPKENFVIVSGIGCSSRFPYYMNTYGFHSIHGRAPTFAMGMKVANPDLSIWIITGDGDGLSIGANHLLHLLRRNFDVTVLLFNNQIYGLTKGQYSPTSKLGHKTPTSPAGSIDHPIKSLSFAIASEAGFVARTIDTNPKHMAEVFKAAAHHKGTAFIEILQNCVIYNNGVWSDIAAREVRDDRLLNLEHQKPLLYGKELNMGIRLNGTTPEIVKIGENAVTLDDILVHDRNTPDPTYAYMLTQMNYPEFPTPVGLLRTVEGRAPYSDLLAEQIKTSIQRKGKGRLQDLLLGNSYWQVDSAQRITMETVPEKIVPEEIPVTAGANGIGEELKVMAELKAAEYKVLKNPILRILREPLTNAILARGTLNPPTLAPTDSVAKAIELFNDRRTDCILIMDKDQKVVGILTGRDIVMKVVQKSMDRKTTTIQSIMTANPVSLKDSATIGLAFNKFSIGQFRHLPVTRKNQNLAVISTTDLLFYIYDRVHMDPPANH